MAEKKKPRRLKNLRITGVAFVDKGANGLDFSIVKRLYGEETMDPEIPTLDDDAIALLKAGHMEDEDEEKKKEKEKAEAEEKAKAEEAEKKKAEEEEEEAKKKKAEEEDAEKKAKDEKEKKEKVDKQEEEEEDEEEETAKDSDFKRMIADVMTALEGVEGAEEAVQLLGKLSESISEMPSDNEEQKQVTKKIEKISDLVPVLHNMEDITFAKAGRKVSSKNLELIKTAFKSLGDLLAKINAEITSDVKKEEGKDEKELEKNKDGDKKEYSIEDAKVIIKATVLNALGV